MTDTKHPLDIDLMEIADHLRMCSLCRLKLWRMMWGEDAGDDEAASERTRFMRESQGRES
jgi:hypothetical protein